MRSTVSPTLRFTHVYLENWRNFANVEVDLQQRVFIVGPNASGKSNLLDVFRFLHDIVSVGGGFQEAVRKRGGVSRLRCLAARRYSDIVIRVRIGTDNRASTWQYELRFNQDNLQRPIIRGERVQKQGRTILERPDNLDDEDRERLTQTYLEQVNANKEFREMATFITFVRYLHIVPQLVREPDRSAGKRNDPYGGDFLEQIARTGEQTQRARLQRIRDALSVAVPQLQELELWRDMKGTPHLRLITSVGATLGSIHGKNGKHSLRRGLVGYNAAARWSPWVVLIDLNRDENCAPPLRQALLPQPAPHMCFRVVVRAIESWLLGDRERLARFLSVPVNRIPQDPETLPHPKQTMVNIARRSRRRDIRKDMVPRSRSGRAVGPAYTSRLVEFAENHWRPQTAAGRVDSLGRCLRRINDLATGTYQGAP